jgi:hypothetical protein
VIDEIQRLLDDYVAWLKDKTTLRQVSDNWVEITTPYLDCHNDYLQIYVRKNNGGFLLSDDGYVVEDLKQSGCKLDSPKRQDLLRMTLSGFGVQNSEGRLEVAASVENFALRKHNLVQAMLAVNDLFFLAEPMVASLFYEDVVAWMDAEGIRYTPNVKFTGKSGYDHLFDFVIPKSRKRPERIIQTINRPSRETAMDRVVQWFDTKDARASDSKAYAFLNDQEQKVSQTVIDALDSYDVTPVPWSRKEEVREELVA